MSGRRIGQGMVANAADKIRAALRPSRLTWDAGGTLESAENRRLNATGASATIRPTMREAEKQFSLIRAASTNQWGAKSNFL